MDRSQADPRPWAEISFDVDCLTVWYWVPSFVSPVWERILAAFPAQGESFGQLSYQRKAASCTPRRIPPHPFHGITLENPLRSSVGNEKVEAVGYERPWGQVSQAS
jgi:hypothetical protein